MPISSIEIEDAYEKAFKGVVSHVSMSRKLELLEIEARSVLEHLVEAETTLLEINTQSWSPEVIDAEIDEALSSIYEALKILR